ncbi:uncharacterized protein LOC125441491 isoform X2 [Sphaerodactylus townsendi]|uniref:uncharacterized protein LOC125441491 isoform X2 n=1 Tax=Sphaerodactylus townsendi TaxID=933632 RepID=UPI002026B6D7|nr:uncharacterized protein LOC125441491 isoform X2 [Sphaerodactylus townsendi]
MNGAKTSRVQEHGFDSQEPSAKGHPISTLSDEFKDSKNIVHRSVRMVRKFPEDSEAMLVGNRQALLPASRTTCVCPEVLSKSTLVAIVSSLAVLGFFSTLVLLLIAIIILRLVEKHWKREKKEKKERKESLAPKKSVPPVPRRPSERIYVMPKESPPYKTMKSVMEAEESSYVDPKELHPGPRSTPEKAYTSMNLAPHFSPSPEHIYASIREPSTSYGTTEEPQAESVANVSGSLEEQPKGNEEHFYEEIN